MKLKYFLVLISLPYLTSCGLFSKKEDPTPVQPVPVKARTTPEPKKRVFVFPFVDVTAKKPIKITEAARRAFITELHSTDKFVIIKNEDFEGNIQDLLTNNQYNLAKATEIAGKMGMNAVMEGQILEIETKKLSDDVGIVRKMQVRVTAKVRLRVYSTQNQKEVYNEIRTATLDDSTTRIAEYPYSDRYLQDDPELVEGVVKKAFQGVVPTLVARLDRMTWRGRVAMVSGDRIYINAGRVSGIQVGDLLKVLDKGDEVYDPESGAYLGYAQGRMKGTIEVVSYFGTDGSIGVIHSGAGFKESDSVEFY